MGGYDTQRDLLPLQRIGGGDHLSQPRATIGEETHPDRRADVG